MMLHKRPVVRWFGGSVVRRVALLLDLAGCVDGGLL